MARPRKSDAVKAAQGTLQKCRMRQVSTSGFELTLEPPIALTQDARDAWELAVKCAPKGVLVATDATVLAWIFHPIRFETRKPLLSRGFRHFWDPELIL